VGAELGFHLEMRRADLVARGATPEEAGRLVRERFGDVEAVAAECRTITHRRERRRTRHEWLGALAQDLRFAFRTLGRDRIPTTVAVLTLALGIGASTVMFALVDGVLLRPLPYSSPGQLVSVWPERGFSVAEVTGFSERSRTFDEVAAYRANVGVSLSGDDGSGRAPDRVESVRTTANLFHVLGTGAALGRTFGGGEDRPGSEPVVLLSDGLWRDRFGADPGTVGRTIQVDGEGRTVVGNMPPDFQFPTGTARLWIPMMMDPANVGAFWGTAGFRVIARLAPGATAAQAREELLRVAGQLRVENPLWTPAAEGYLAGAEVVPLKQQMVGGVRRMLLLLLGAVGLVPLIACVNVANLLLARGLARGRELAVRAALGAGRARLVRQLLTESLLLALLGGGAGVLLAAGGLRLVLRLLPADVPRLGDVTLDARVLGVAFIATLGTSMVFGLLPAIRTARPETSDALRQRSTGGGRRGRLQAVLVAVEMALAVVLVTGAGMLLRGVSRLQHVDPGFATEDVVTARLSPPEREYQGRAAQLGFYDGVLERAAALPGVETVALTSQLPFDQENTTWATSIEGVTTDPNDLPMFDRRSVTADYFRVLGVPLRRGRAFSEADVVGAPLVAIVDEAAARRFWPGQDPIGRRVGWPWANEWRTVVGVAATVRNGDLVGEPPMAVYVPFAQAPVAGATLVIRSVRPPAQLAPEFRQLVASIGADVPVTQVRAMDEVVRGTLGRERLATLLLGAFAVVALVLGAVGLYGVTAYQVGQRRGEIGVRMALGARASDVLRQVLARSVTLALAGTAVGLVGALALSRVLDGILPGGGAVEPVVLLAVPLVLLVVSILATLVPAIRAASVEPTVALSGG